MRSKAADRTINSRSITHEPVARLIRNRICARGCYFDLPAAQELSRSPALVHTRTEFKFTVDAPFGQSRSALRRLTRGASGRQFRVLRFINPNQRAIRKAWSFRLPTGTIPAHMGQYGLRSRRRTHPVCLRAADEARIQNLHALIDIHLTRESAQKTGVTVVYERHSSAPGS